MSVDSEDSQSEWAMSGHKAASTLLVCTRCNWTGSEAERAGPRGALLRLVRAVAGGVASVQAVACLSGCKRACAIGVMAPGKVTYLFGDLPPTPDAAADIAAFALQHAHAVDGWVPRADRPPTLREGILARLPPLAWATDGEIAWPGIPVAAGSR